jgi:hypothetical protein
MRMGAVLAGVPRRHDAVVLSPFIWMVGQDVVHPAQQRLKALFH